VRIPTGASNAFTKWSAFCDVTAYVVFAAGLGYYLFAIARAAVP
jgi:hypothetical protein